MILGVLGVRSSDGFEGRNLFLSDRKRGHSRRMLVFIFFILFVLVATK